MIKINRKCNKQRQLWEIQQNKTAPLHITWVLLICS